MTVIPKPPTLTDEEYMLIQHLHLHYAGQTKRGVTQRVSELVLRDGYFTKISANKRMIDWSKHHPDGKGWMQTWEISAYVSGLHSFCHVLSALFRKTYLPIVQEDVIAGTLHFGDDEVSRAAAREAFMQNCKITIMVPEDLTFVDTDVQRGPWIERLTPHAHIVRGSPPLLK